MTPACMGGWCRIRDRCANYTRPADEVVERMCLPGMDGSSDAYPVRVHRPAGTWSAADVATRPLECPA